MNEELNNRMISFVLKHAPRNMYLARLSGIIRRKGIEGLTANQLESIKKRMKDKDGGLPFDFEQLKEGGFLE